MPDPKRQAQGKASRAKGLRFEERLDAAFEAYKVQGIASVEKTPEPMKVLRPIGKGRFEACFVKKAQPDYEGTIHGGRSLMFEAKYTDKDRMDKNRVRPEQSDYLDERAALGAWCYVLAGFSTGNVYRIPWRVWSEMKERFGRKYITEADVINYRVQETPDGRLLLLDKHERSNRNEGRTR